ncbi:MULTISPECIES: SDR family oxidoreductase [Bacillaceae]|uniref:SDR family oxidoreductase n=1 Tax=Evansella alkalicola TaxID=745819 RepID=A0ABS6JS25_9BACI|nr:MULTISPECIES: SDR family oxidoreductase [Bacillaceae]MBU9721225.1 SDR family oxidoreductase [Bacillus alkalicola]
MKQIVLITGASSGFGHLAALELAEKGYHVLATMRDSNKMQDLYRVAKTQNLASNIDIINLDVTDSSQINKMKEYIDDNYGTVDILINNAGYSLGGITEFIDMEEWELQMQTNIIGVIAITKAVLPLMRERRSGKIINIGSISGRLGFPGMAPYVTSKFALEGFSESLRLELLPFNIKVSIIEAGSYKTNIWEKGLRNVKIVDHPDYSQFFDKIKDNAQRTAYTASDPMEVIKLLVKICSNENPKLRYQVGKGVKLLILLKSILPWNIIERIIHRKLNIKI